MEKVCVLGAGSTKYGKLEDSISDITVQASVDAIENAGIEPKEIQAGYISNVFGVADKQVHLGPVVMSNLGISECPSLSIESACGSGSVSFREAFANGLKMSSHFSKGSETKPRFAFFCAEMYPSVSL